MHAYTADAAIIRLGFRGKIVAQNERYIARTNAEESGKFRVKVFEAVFVFSKNDEIVAACNRADY